jgi:hypothetical protein
MEFWRAQVLAEDEFALTGACPLRWIGRQRPGAGATQALFYPLQPLILPHFEGRFPSSPVR